MKRSWITVFVVAAWFGPACVADDLSRCATLTWFRDQANLYRVATLADAYVVDSRSGLVGYHGDNAKRFSIRGNHWAFDGTSADELLTVTLDQEGVALLAWASDGALIEERSRIAAVTQEDLDGAVVLADGSALVWGSTEDEPWTGVLSPGSEGSRQATGGPSRKAAVASADGGAFVVDEKPHASGEGWRIGERVLSRLGPDHAPLWSTTVAGDFADALEFVSLAGAVGDGVIVMLDERSIAPKAKLLHYAGDGTVSWTLSQPSTDWGRPPQALGLDDGTTLLIDAQRPEAGDPTIRIRFVDEDGEVVCEPHLPGDGRLVTDAAMRNGELFVVSIDRINRISLGVVPR